MAGWLRFAYVGFSCLVFGMVLAGFFAVIAINRLERENERLQRLVRIVTEDVTR